MWLSRLPAPAGRRTRLNSMALRPASQDVGPVFGQGDAQHAHIGLGLEHVQRLGVKAGAISTSTNCLATTCAAASSSVQLKAMMPPKAEVGSVWKALL
jgi:hypothetical protein